MTFFQYASQEERLSAAKAKYQSLRETIDQEQVDYKARKVECLQEIDRIK